MKNLLLFICFFIMRYSFSQVNDTLYIEIVEPKKVSVHQNVILPFYKIGSSQNLKTTIFTLHQVKTTHLQFYFNYADSSAIKELSKVSLKNKTKTPKQIDDILHLKVEERRKKEHKKILTMTNQMQMLYSTTSKNDYGEEDLIRDYFKSFQIFLIVVKDEKNVVEVIPVKYLPNERE